MMIEGQGERLPTLLILTPLLHPAKCLYAPYSSVYGQDSPAACTLNPLERVQWRVLCRTGGWHPSSLVGAVVAEQSSDVRCFRQPGPAGAASRCGDRSEEQAGPGMAGPGTVQALSEDVANLRKVRHSAGIKDPFGPPDSVPATA